MKKEQVIQALRKYARKNGKNLEIDKSKGKGSHYWITLEGKSATLQDKLNPGRIERFLKQLGLTPADL